MTHILITQRQAQVAQVTMARAEVFNAFDETLIAELDAAFEQLAVDDNVRLIVLAAEGRHFSAGADLNWMQRASSATPQSNLADARRFAAMLWRIASCPKPTLARVQGAALGGGVGLACACDVVIAADNASFAVTEARFGILPAVIGPYLVGAVGARQARRLALTGQRVDAQAALGLGLVHQVAAAAALDEAVDQTLTDLLAGGPLAQREIKQLFAQLDGAPIDDSQRELCAQTISRVRSGDEARAGFAAFFAKQAAPWAAP